MILRYSNTCLSATNAKTGMVYDIVPIMRACASNSLISPRSIRSFACKLVQLCDDTAFGAWLEVAMSSDPLGEERVVSLLNLHLQSWAHGMTYMYFIMHDGMPFGILELDCAFAKGALGYALHSSASGIMTPAVAALTQYVRGLNPEHPLCAFIDPNNQRSRAVVERLNFVQAPGLHKYSSHKDLLRYDAPQELT